MYIYIYIYVNIISLVNIELRKMCFVNKYLLKIW